MIHHQSSAVRACASMCAPPDSLHLTMSLHIALPLQIFHWPHLSTHIPKPAVLSLSLLSALVLTLVSVCPSCTCLEYVHSPDTQGRIYSSSQDGEWNNGKEKKGMIGEMLDLCSEMEGSSSSPASWHCVVFNALVFISVKYGQTIPKSRACWSIHETVIWEHFISSKVCNMQMLVNAVNLQIITFQQPKCNLGL